jgi:Ca2+-binding EF-hand superfamily protein
MVDKRIALKSNFAAVDTNRDGMLSLEEMSKLLKKGNPSISDASIKTCFDKVAGADGKVSFDEFVDYICPSELDLLKKKLPCDKSDESKKKRKGIFMGWDKNGNKILSLAEIDKGIREELGVGDIGPTGLAPVLMRAYQVARDYGGGIDMTKVYGMKAAMELKKSDIYASTVNMKEFRILLEYIAKYFKLFEVYKKIDKDFDGRVGAKEYEAGKAAMVAEGFPEATFAELDGDGAGMCLFDEFCAYMIGKAGLDVDGDDDDN